MGVSDFTPQSLSPPSPTSAHPPPAHRLRMLKETLQAQDSLIHLLEAAIHLLENEACGRGERSGHGENWLCKFMFCCKKPATASLQKNKRTQINMHIYMNNKVLLILTCNKSIFKILIPTLLDLLHTNLHWMYNEFFMFKQY